MPQLVLGMTSDPRTQVKVESGGAIMRRSVLPGGIRVLTEHMPGTRSAAFGAWVAIGSRDEAEGHYGSTHFLEHLLFKGTPTRSALDIASAFDRVGGESNAATSKEYTVYYARVLDEDLPMAIDVIIDMITSSVLDEHEFEAERGVILEELAMSYDDPTDVAHERFAQAVFGSHPLGRPIGGTPKTIQSLSRQALLDHYQANYRSEELVVTAAGNVDHDQVCDLVMQAVTKGGWSTNHEAQPVQRRVADNARAQDIPTTGSQLRLARDTEQANVIVGGGGLTSGDERRYPMAVLNAILGGSMSSRLFQEVREKRGLAYSVFSFASGFTDAGTFGMYAGCSPRKVDEVVQLLETEFEKIATSPVDPDELARGIGQVSGGLVLGMEDTGSRMSWLGRAELALGEYVTLDEQIQRIQAVTSEQVTAVARELYDHPRHVVVVGPEKLG